MTHVWKRYKDHGVRVALQGMLYPRAERLGVPESGDLTRVPSEPYDVMLAANRRIGTLPHSTLYGKHLPRVAHISFDSIGAQRPFPFADGAVSVVPDLKNVSYLSRTATSM